ncbi:Sterol 26-hydroxylase, mitochondrial [Seminavis robusta]|uniref:Sterol 26-hydroxylase, mitochondrial n=1 Tax=Seminavis robusta TaxID=568900 RepID=A0A9N8DKE3_9STRA|nr:Sterol 26-hydroxylase, mitochondrial [Seminavis robusta]|eukprot:Sro202_g085520.1 Sterol 26-hydroxylase, mitochondrial (427) ;mRNA; r:78599-80293
MLPQLSGIPDSPLQPFTFWPAVRQKFGDFYTMDFLVWGTPAGTGMETSPSVYAEGLAPGMIQVAQLASEGAPASAEDLNAYVKRCAFDMFCSIMFGQLTQVADPSTPTEPENQQFVAGASSVLSLSVEILLDPKEILMNYLGMESAKSQRTFEAFDVCWEIAQKKIASFEARKIENQLTDLEQNSYLARALDRQKEPDGGVSVREAHEVVFAVASFFPAVDSTSAVLALNMFHVAREPQVQEKLFLELKNSVETAGSKDGGLTVEALSRQIVPYLHAVIRETQRLSPTSALYLVKQIDTDGIVAHGTPLSKGDVVSLEGFSIGMDPQFVENPDEFRPDRWLPEAVASRKGTPSEIIDHPFLKEPFSQGARKCPGSRVAANEIQVMLSQLVLDWKMTSPIASFDETTYSMCSAVEVIFPQLTFEARV